MDLKISGIYQIVNLINNSKYIGSALKVSLRWNRHKSDLRLVRHPNKHLQNAWNKYGEENFIFEIIEECEKEKLIEREQFYLDTLKPEYNKRMWARSNLGIKCDYTEKSFEKNRLNPPRKNKIHTKETKEKMSISRSGERCWCAKLTKKQVEEIRLKYVPFKYSTYKLAKEYNVAKSTIEAIINYRSWKRI